MRPIWIPGRGELTGTWVKARFAGIEDGVVMCFTDGDFPHPVKRSPDEVRFADPGGERPRASSQTEYGPGGRVTLQQLSATKVAISRDCPAKFGYRYPDGLRSRVEKDPTRIRGRSIHAGLEGGYRAWRTLRMLLSSPNYPPVFGA